MARLIFFDIETRKLAEELRPDDTDAGWDGLRAGDGGCSALVIYDTKDRWLHLYDDHSITAAVGYLEIADVVVGFRSEGFDIPAIEGILGRNLRLKYHYDLFTEIARANARRGIVGYKGDLTLDTLARKNLGRGKIGHGSDVTTLIGKGHWAQLFEYCASDVHLTYDLFNLACQQQGLLVMNSFLSLEIPSWIRNSAKNEY
jgi:hypothetical protein